MLKVLYENERSLDFNYRLNLHTDTFTNLVKLFKLNKTVIFPLWDNESNSLNKNIEVGSPAGSRVRHGHDSCILCH